MTGNNEHHQTTSKGLRELAFHLLSAAQGELRSLLLLAAVAACMLGFAGLAGAIRHDSSHELDRAVLLALREPDDPSEPIGPAWVEKAALDITALGGVAVLALITLIVIGYLLLAGARRQALLVALASAGGAAMLGLLKNGFDRPRPDLVPHLVQAASSSFPSGHAMASAMIYLTLGTLLTRIQGRRRLRIYVPSVAVVITVLVGLTRVYLGVHWPTDVVAGWLAGATWALLCWLVLDWLAPERRPVSGHPTR